MRNNHRYILSFFLLALMCGCTGTKFLAEGERFYSGAELVFIQDSVKVNNKPLARDLQVLIQPAPNTKILGSRPAVWFHNIAGEPKKEKGFKYWVKYKLGKAPVLASEIKETSTAARLTNYLHNHGYFRASVTSGLKSRTHSTKAIYTIRTGVPYTLRNLIYEETDSIYLPHQQSVMKESLLQEGDRYELEKLQAEQSRIENYLEDHGFYYFDDNYLLYKADSSVGDHQVDLTLTLAEDTPERAKKIFTLSDVIIRPDYSVSNDTIKQVDSTEVHYGYTFINNDDYIRPDILTETVVFKPGDNYSQQAESRTRERLMALGTYKFVNMKFDRSDSSSLNSSIYLTPLPKKSLRLEVQALSKSNNFLGPALSLAFQNRNTFRGAELFELKLNTSYEVQVGGQNNPPLNAYEINLEGNLTIPRLITPFSFNYRSLRFIPSTRISLGTRLQRRINVFQINSFEAKYGFLWQETYTKRHELYPVNLSFVQLSQTSGEFDRRLETDLNLARSLEDQFIIGALYEYTFNSKNAKDADDRRHHFFFNGLLDISGNLLNLTERVVNRERSGQDDGVSYSQYTKVQLDFRYFQKLGSKKTLATRLILGAARAYGNSREVPFIKQFSAGGSNSIRAFRARSLGPGTSNTDNDESSIVLDETGDLKIEANLEYRSPLIGVLEGALFLDAGNIWLWDSRTEKPGASFDSKFMQDMAVGAGAGLRFNFSFFILRFDLAFPIRQPGKWVLDEVNPLEKNWRKDNLLLNIAIGYPF
ncbi:BamA/TamA family outer membrane protein [Fulvivirga sp. M361]|uniref:translocation and assembly module lipoprotein TamL n=1 Tax=Fulvivirga sp. M361 TaxID=2594266 RepID=UPI00162802DB|nr:BamA/TamA family outer membrane protein [Fulvivirga sp. M361]